LRLEDLKSDALVKGIRRDEAVTVVAVKWIGDDVLDLTYRASGGQLGQQLVYRDQEPRLEIVEAGKQWAFSADGALFKLVLEAYRIRLAHLFDPLLAVHTSLIEPLPHQLTAVYESMLPRQPLRFLLADDPGAGKTIMSGLLIKELIARGDLERCLVVCPGMLAEQWQDELWEKFRLPFEILTNDKYESARTGNWFQENNLVVARLDKLSRNEDVQQKLSATDWDLVVVDEAHKMSASVYGHDVRYTKRHQLGQKLSHLTRHFLLLTATPHNGKEGDFHLFLSLLDEDRFEGRFRDGVHSRNASDLMRRLSKERLLRFDGTPLFPERRAITVEYKLSTAEAELYELVTNYVRNEFDRAERIENARQRGTVGFALTALQRRLASSPEAIYQSLRRRREKLERRLEEFRLLKRGFDSRHGLTDEMPDVTDDTDNLWDETPSIEYEELEEKIVDGATASASIEELQIEIGLLRDLEEQARQLRNSRTDAKWSELRELLIDDANMIDGDGHRRKLVIFTEHRDTLRYLNERIETLLGQPETIATIHGSMHRDERRDVQNRFTQDKGVAILLATDAAGEGINLQRAHLMINYDLPWNPNRLEQRFGRIHRIGQNEVCTVWNLCASETREGDVYARLLKKLEAEQRDLPGDVFNILGEPIDGKPLRELLLEAVRHGESPEVQERLKRAVNEAFDPERIRALVKARALTSDVMDADTVHRIREEMERAEARRLQPHFIQAFFLEAFRYLSGSFHRREPKRFEVTHVPALIRTHMRSAGTRDRVQPRYERITFAREEVTVQGKPVADFVCPGHPLLESTAEILMEEHSGLLKQGALLVDPEDLGTSIRALYVLEHAVMDTTLSDSGHDRALSKQFQFVEIDETGKTRSAGYAPHLDLRPITEEEMKLITEELNADWLAGTQLENTVLRHAVEELVPRHLQEVRERQESLVTRTRAAVKDRLEKEIRYWDLRAQRFKEQEQAGKQPRMNWQKAKERADELTARLRRRLALLDRQLEISSALPVVRGGALVIPIWLLEKGGGPWQDSSADERLAVERIAMETVQEAERSLGFEPVAVGSQNLGYDVESRDPRSGSLRFIEVKGRAKGATTVTVTRNEIMTAFNKPDAFILALVEVDGDRTDCRYVRHPFEEEPEFSVTSINYKLRSLWERGEHPG